MSAFCAHFGTCGGCLMQDMAPADYRAAKRDMVRSALRRHGIDAAWEENGELAVATRPHELAGLAAHAAALRVHGRDVVELGLEPIGAQNVRVEAGP